MSDFEILGIKPGFSAEELRIAYSQKVCEYPPEKEPENFERVWEAYNRLLDSLEFVPVFEDADKLEKYRPVLREIKKVMESEDTEKFYSVSKSAMEKYPDSAQILYYNVIAQLYMEEFDTAEENAKRLVEIRNNDVNSLITLACVYMKRDMMDKFAEIVEKVLSMKVYDTDFILVAAMYTYDSKYSKLSDRLAGRFIRNSYIINKENMYDALILFDRYVRRGITSGRRDCVYGSLDQLPGYFLQFLRINCKYIKEYVVFCCEIISSMGIIMAAKGIPMSHEGFDGFDLILRMAETETDLREAYYFKMCSIADSMLMNKGFDDELAQYCRMVVAQRMGDFEDRERFYKLDCEMCLLRDRKRTLRQIEKMKTEYPDMYVLLEESKAKLSDDENIGLMRMNVQEEFNKMLPNYYNSSVYAKRFLQKSGETKADFREPIRKGKKIGRNEPCPCGSGKKYKKCCGR